MRQTPWFLELELRHRASGVGGVAETLGPPATGASVGGVLMYMRILAFYTFFSIGRRLLGIFFAKVGLRSPASETFFGVSALRTETIDGYFLPRRLKTTPIFEPFRPQYRRVNTSGSGWHAP